MGFLSGAYGKLQAGRLVRDIQHQLTSINSRIRRVTRDIGNKEKMYQAQERNMKLQMQNQMQNYIMGGLQYSMANAQDPELAKQLGIYGSMMGGNFNTSMFSGFGSGNSSIMAQATGIYSMIQQQAQMQFTQSMTMWQNMQEMQKQADLDALKDLEQDLQTEKDNLESRLAIAKEEYDAKKQEEKDGAKSLQPDYTGQG